MLKRKMLDTLRSWRSQKKAECLLIKGARQVGKSYIVNHFGHQEYASHLVLDFIEHPEFRNIFQGPLDPDLIYQQISLLVPGARFVPNDTLLFLDEIQECPEARTALKYLAQDGRCDVIASGSLLGIQYKEAAERTPIPVGYERTIEMHPLDFEEFLWARGLDEQAVAGLRSHLDELAPIPQAVHTSMMRHLREYLALGGMPAVVQAFVDSNNYNDAHAEQTKLLDSYLDDIARYAPPSERVKARACYLSLPRQLAKENTKFQYSVVEKGGSNRKFAGSVDWLEGSRIVLPCRAVSTPQFPLAAYEDEGRFRLYANDTGLLMAMYGYEMKAAVIENTLAGPMKGGLYENLVGSMLAKCNIPLRYWVSQNGSQEIEFLVDRNATVVPVEVKASRGSSASLNRQLERPEVKIGYKLIDGNLGQDGKKVTVPLYLAPFLFASNTGMR